MDLDIQGTQMSHPLECNLDFAFGNAGVPISFEGASRRQGDVVDSQDAHNLQIHYSRL